MVESVLFGSGRHVFLVPPSERRKMEFGRILVAWKGSREAARALAEARPYLGRAQSVSICVVGDKRSEERALLGSEAVTHLCHHGVDATLHQITKDKRGIDTILISEAKRLEADLVVMGAYGHSRMREYVFGGATHWVLQNISVPVLMSH